MKLNRSKFAVGMAVALAAAGAASARADVSYQIVNSQADLETFSLTIDGTVENGLTGGIQLTQSPVGNDASMPQNLVSICTDLRGVLYLGDTYTYKGPVAFAGQTGLDPTWGAGNAGAPPGPVNMNDASAAIQVAADIFANHQAVLAGANVSNMAALQLAVWGALYNTAASGLNAAVENGTRFSVTGSDSAAISTANSWIASAITDYDNGVRYSGSLLIPDPNVQQGNIAQELLYNVTAVPEPSTVMAGALLLLPFAAGMMRSLRRK